MDNNNSVPVHFDDLFESLLIDNFIEPDPALVLPNVEPKDAQPQPQNVTSGVQQDNVAFMEPNIQDQFMHGSINNVFNGGGIGNFEIGSSSNENMGPQNHQGVISLPFGIGNFEIGSSSNENMGPQNHQGVISLPFWPPIPRPLICTCCQVLRQIIHTNGFEFEKLEIHGMIGVISHAIIHKRNITPSEPSSDAHQMIDFCHKSAEQVKSFLVKYCTQQIASGYIMVEDSMSAYYEALCTGMDWTKDSIEGDKDLIPPHVPEPVPEKGKKTKRSRAEQSKRIRLMTLDDLKDMFHITLDNAAKQLDMSDSCVKFICRRGKLERWPQRKVNSNARQIGVLRRALDSPDAGVRARTRAIIERLQEQIIEACGGITPTGIEMIQF